MLAVGLLGGLAAFGALVTGVGVDDTAAPRATERHRADARSCSSAGVGAVVAAAVGLRRHGLGGRRARRRRSAVGRRSGHVAAARQRRRRASNRRASRRWRRGASSCAICLSADHGIHRHDRGDGARRAPQRCVPRSRGWRRGWPARAAESRVRQFATEVDDPSGDLVASVLLLAMSRSVAHRRAADRAGGDDPRAGDDAFAGRGRPRRATQRGHVRVRLRRRSSSLGVIIFGRGTRVPRRLRHGVRPARVGAGGRHVRDRRCGG